MDNVPLIKTDFNIPGEVYQVQRPEIESGSHYYFQTASSLKYQVIFGKKKDNYLSNIVNFSVISEEYDDEYVETNKGEVYSIIRTMISIFRIYHEHHPYSISYEFSGEFKEERENAQLSIRSKLYFREALRVIDQSYWNVKLIDNKVLVQRKVL